jgi:hypothetical protein
MDSDEEKKVGAKKKWNDFILEQIDLADQSTEHASNRLKKSQKEWKEKLE